MILQKRSPRLRRWLAASRHVLAHTGFADVDTKLEEFSMDARRSPKRVVAAHLANQLASFDRHAGAAATPMTGFPCPKQAESGSVPSDDRLRFDNDQGRAPAPPSGCQTCPEEPVRSGQLRPLDRALEHIELVAQSKHLHLKGSTAAKAIPRRCQNGQYR